LVISILFGILVNTSYTNKYLGIIPLIISRLGDDNKSYAEYGVRYLIMHYFKLVKAKGNNGTLGKIQPAPLLPGRVAPYLGYYYKNTGYLRIGSHIVWVYKGILSIRE
jgi:hypothetical protein